MAAPAQFNFHFMTASSGFEENRGSSTVSLYAFKDLTHFVCELEDREAFKVKLAIMQCMEDLKIKSLSFVPKNPEKKQTIYIENFTPLASPTLEGLFKPFPTYRLEEKPPVRITNHADWIASAIGVPNLSWSTPLPQNGTQSGELTDIERVMLTQALSYRPTYKNIPEMRPEILANDGEIILELADIEDKAMFKTLQKIVLLLKDDPETYALAVGFLDGAQLKTKSWTWRTDLDTGLSKIDGILEQTL